MFEGVWPRCEQEVQLVLKSINTHAELVRNEATVLDIQEAREARVQTMAKFAKMDTVEERQKFQLLKERVSPEMYDGKLDWVLNRSVANCARWLFRDKCFLEWLDISNRVVAWFWLQGIPGAGKTYLSAAAIDYIRTKQERVLFAFVSHVNCKVSTALSVIQSLIFQAAEDDQDFQSLLVESKERELRGSTGHACHLLENFLKTSQGPTYIVIDGLDEMDECERQILLQQLDRLSETSENLRLLISSRAEDDISQALDKKATSAKVHDRNYGSIQNYIDHRSQAWVSCHAFDPNTKSEILSLLSPLSVNARGEIT
jgi:Cdc6-like AAA superfamily ATPase